MKKIKDIDNQKKQSKICVHGFLIVVYPKLVKYYYKCKVRMILLVDALYDLWWTVKFLCENQMHVDIIELGL